MSPQSYQKARDEMSNKFYDRDRAMWYLDCATNLNPIFSEALTAKQRVSGQILMESDNSSMRHFVQNLIMEERAIGVPVVEPVTPMTPVVPPADVEPRSAAPTTAPTPLVEAAKISAISEVSESKGAATSAE